MSSTRQFLHWQCLSYRKFQDAWDLQGVRYLSWEQNNIWGFSAAFCPFWLSCMEKRWIEVCKPYFCILTKGHKQKIYQMKTCQEKYLLNFIIMLGAGCGKGNRRFCQSSTKPRSNQLSRSSSAKLHWNWLLLESHKIICTRIAAVSNTSQNRLPSSGAAYK